MKQDITTIADKIGYVQDTLQVIGGKWKLPILLAMHADKNRFRDIQRCIPAITTRVLSKELKELEMNQLITRTVHNTHPVTIHYALTSYSHTLTPVAGEMIKWGKQNGKSGSYKI